LSRRIRVLIVDDSAFARKVLRDVIAGAPDIEVVDWARDGLEALEKVETTKPDVLTLDLMMPGLDGLGVLRALQPGGPRVLVVSLSAAESELGLQALEAGAVDLVHKPTALATDRLYEMGAELLAKIRTVAGARAPLPLVASAPAIAMPRPPPPTGRTRLLAIGTSTGGPQALTRILPALPADFPVPVVVGLHIPAGYTTSLARRLDELASLSIAEAADQRALESGTILIAPGGSHLEIERHAGGLRVHTIARTEPSTFAPSIDRLLCSAAEADGSGVLAVILTGMGDDGCAGAKAVKAAGGRVLAEAESSCVVYGMPRCVIEAGLADEVVPIEDMVAAILRHL